METEYNFGAGSGARAPACVCVCVCVRRVGWGVGKTQITPFWIGIHFGSKCFPFREDTFSEVDGVQVSKQEVTKMPPLYQAP